MKISKVALEVLKATIDAGAKAGKSPETVAGEIGRSVAFTRKHWPASAQTATPSPLLGPSTPAPGVALPSSTASPLEKALKAAGVNGTSSTPGSSVEASSIPSLPAGMTAEQVAEEIVDSADFAMSMILGIYAARMGFPPTADISRKLTKDEKDRLKTAAVRGAPYLGKLTGGPIAGAIMFGGYLGKAMMERAAEIKARSPRRRMPPGVASTPAASVSPAGIPVSPVVPQGPKEEPTKDFLESFKAATGQA